jgi:mono/diheme cytochrome c family protein
MVCEEWMAPRVLPPVGVLTIQRFLVACLLFTACGKKSDDKPPEPLPPASVAPTADDVAAAKTVFAQRCTPCHGPSGTGDGPASASLNPKPRNYTDAAWQASVDDPYLEKIIKFGGAAVGKSPAMPNNPDLSPGVISALKDIVRAFNKK